MNDLIERQAAIDVLDVLCQEHRYKIPGKAETYSQYNEAWQDALDRAEGAIGNLPSAEPKTGGWIPCSERLPEEEGWYLVTIQNDKTRKRRTENDLFAIGIAEAHKHTPYKFCKDGHRQTVIAWMPLPEPYKGGDTE